LISQKTKKKKAYLPTQQLQPLDATSSHNLPRSGDVRDVGDVGMWGCSGWDVGDVEEVGMLIHLCARGPDIKYGRGWVGGGGGDSVSTLLLWINRAPFLVFFRVVGALNKSMPNI
jgi:hypothetical protein